MIETKQNVAPRTADPYLEQFERFQNDGPARIPSWLDPIRKAAFDRFAELGFPTLQQEDWRYTNVAPIAKLPFRPVLEPGVESVSPSILETIPFGRLPRTCLVFVNGHFSRELSSVHPQTGGVQVTSIASALAEGHEALEKHLTRYASGQTEPFAALNTAFFTDGAFIYLPADARIDGLVHLVFVSTASEPGRAIHPRNLFIAERHSRATIVESYLSAVEQASVTNAVTECVIGEGAVVEHCKFQDESTRAFHVSTLHAQLGRSCDFVSHSIATGARLARNHIRASLAGEGSDCVLNGLYLTKAEQLIDHHMIVEHAKPHCNSHEYFNGILDDHSRGVFHGRILVQPGAQKTDAKQTNKNLLLSDDATANAKPQLEIYADDVKCTHGATVGQLNKESIFYLRARGISAETARRILMHAFAGEIIDRIRYEPVREELDKLVWERLEQHPLIGEQRRN